MTIEGNEMMKRFLQKLISQIIKQKDFEVITSVEVFFVFGSKHKTAMCDWVYGMKIYSDIPLTWRSEIAKQLQMKIRSNTDKLLNSSVCCTDVMFVKNYDN
jgi:hypothetical protein